MIRTHSVMTAAQWNEFIARIQSLETDAHKLGMHETAHALNAAKNKAGYERVGQLEKASRG